MNKWIKSFLSLEDDTYFQLDPKKEYSLDELINILEKEHLDLGTGNKIVLKILSQLVQERNENL